MKKIHPYISASDAYVPAALDINRAKDMRTWSSSVYSNGVADRGNDGNYNPSYNQNHCIHTGNDYNPWWGIDLEDVFEVDRVIVANRDSSSMYA